MYIHIRTYVHTYIHHTHTHIHTHTAANRYIYNPIALFCQNSKKASRNT
jgi:hypothetical protein